MPRPVEDRSDVGGAAQSNNIGPVPLSASCRLIDEKYVVFNVGGNKYRLIAIVSYPKGKVYIQHVLTHKEYDRGAWKGD